MVPFYPSDQLRGSHIEHPAYAKEGIDAGRLNLAFHDTHEGAVNTGAQNQPYLRETGGFSRST